MAEHRIVVRQPSRDRAKLPVATDDLFRPHGRHHKLSWCPKGACPISRDSAAHIHLELRVLKREAERAVVLSAAIMGAVPSAGRGRGRAGCRCGGRRGGGRGEGGRGRDGGASSAHYLAARSTAHEAVIAEEVGHLRTPEATGAGQQLDRLPPNPPRRQDARGGGEGGGACARGGGGDGGGGGGGGEGSKLMLTWTSAAAAADARLEQRVGGVADRVRAKGPDAKAAASGGVARGVEHVAPLHHPFPLRLPARHCGQRPRSIEVCSSVTRPRPADQPISIKCQSQQANKPRGYARESAEVGSRDRLTYIGP